MSKRKARADAATVERRVTTIIERILAGESTRKILQDPSIKKWDLTDRSIHEYIRKARNEITALGEFDKAHEFGRALARLDRLYSRAEKKGDINAARAVLADRMKMLGIAGPIHIVTDESGSAVTNWVELVRRATDAQQAQGDA